MAQGNLYKSSDAIEQAFSSLLLFFLQGLQSTHFFFPQKKTEYFNTVSTKAALCLLRKASCLEIRSFCCYVSQFCFSVNHTRRIECHRLLCPRSPFSGVTHTAPGAFWKHETPFSSNGTHTAQGGHLSQAWECTGQHGGENRDGLWGRGHSS